MNKRMPCVQHLSYESLKVKDSMGCYEIFGEGSVLHVPYAALAQQLTNRRARRDHLLHSPDYHRRFRLFFFFRFSSNFLRDRSSPARKKKNSFYTEGTAGATKDTSARTTAERTRYGNRDDHAPRKPAPAPSCRRSTA